MCVEPLEKEQIEPLTITAQNYSSDTEWTKEYIIEYKSYIQKIQQTHQTDQSSILSEARVSAASKPNSFLIRATLPPDLAEEAIANLEHYYKTVWQLKHKSATAKAIFYLQNARIVSSHYATTIRNVVELYLKFKK